MEPELYTAEPSDSVHLGKKNHILIKCDGREKRGAALSGFQRHIESLSYIIGE